MSIVNGAGMRFGFAHLSKRLVKAGDPVHEGQEVAEVGSTGASTGPHLHFTVSINNEFIDPAKYFTFLMWFELFYFQYFWLRRHHLWRR